MKRTNVMREKWDYLIILDACRYDYFEKNYQNFLSGKLQKRNSIATTTLEWRDKSFTSYYSDIIYISTNPYITSLAPMRDFNAREHFSEIYDLWLDDWDIEEGTVPPEKVTDKAIKIIEQNTGKKAIIHYMQPHEPYLTNTIETKGYSSSKPGVFVEDSNKQTFRVKLLEKVIRKLGAFSNSIGLNCRYYFWKAREKLLLPPANPMDAVRRKYGAEILRKAYEENLQIVLKQVSRLVDRLDGRIIVTADHGEMLGEKNCYGHWAKARQRKLVEVPWLVIEKEGRTTHPTQRQFGRKQNEPNAKHDQEDRVKIEKKLKALGYHE